jgi:DNA repair protein RadC
MYKIPIVSIKMVKDKDHKYYKRTVSSSKEAFELIKDLIQDSDKEIYLVLCLDNKNHINCIYPVSIGTSDCVFSEPRDILKAVIESNSNKIITAHNHPSGDVNPSINDTENIETLKEASEIFNVKLLDHIIIGDEKYYSFADENLL